MAVHGAKDFTKFTAQLPLITGHKQPVQDLDFSPFHENCLATASADGTLKIWMIPEGGLTGNVTDCDADLKGHSKKVMHMKWHPTSEFTLGSVSMDGCVKIWDV